jgi:hypothetical protein
VPTRVNIDPVFLTAGPIWPDPAAAPVHLAMNDLLPPSNPGTGPGFHPAPAVTGDMATSEMQFPQTRPREILAGTQKSFALMQGDLLFRPIRGDRPGGGKRRSQARRAASESHEHGQEKIPHREGRRQVRAASKSSRMLRGRRV